MKTIPHGMNRRVCNRLTLPVMAIALSLGSLHANAQPMSPATETKQSTKKTTQPGVGNAAVAVQDPGERKFQANCSRCHSAPEQISPRIAGTVVRHMRVRASLSAEDERDILRYLVP
jgi:cytochrome c5